MPNCFWADTISTTVYLIDRYLTTGVHSAWPGKKPNLSHLRFFCCVCYTHILDELTTKLDVKYEKCILSGYSLD